MSFLRSLWGGLEGGRLGAGLAVLRVVAGLAMAQHGWGKVQNAMHWMDKAPNPAPPIFQALAAYSEFLGGLFVAFGFLTPLSAFMVAATMVVAVKFHVGKGDPWVGHEGSYEAALGYLSLMIALLLSGPGRYALDALWVPKLLGGKQEG